MSQLEPSRTATDFPAPDKANSDGATKPARHDRPALVVYAADNDTESALREGLTEAAGAALDVRRGGVRTAIAAMRKGVTPHILIIDIGGEAYPIKALSELASVLEPDVQVVVVGDPNDVDFYRQITRGLGSADYLPKPLTRERVLRHIAPLVSGRAADHAGVQGGQFLTVSGVRGGTGATTIAAYLAWHFAVDRRRHTALLDADLYRGSAAMLLGVRVTGGLRTAMESPQRVDELFIERTAQILDSSPAADRLAVLAAEERLTDEVTYMPGAAAQLLKVMERRYSFVVGDIPIQQTRYCQEFMALAHQRILVLDPSLASLRDTLRILALPNGPMQSRRPIVVLNRAGQPGGLTTQQVEFGLKMAPDVVVQYEPKQMGPAATLGLPEKAMRGHFRASILDLARQAAFEPLLDGPGMSRTRRRRESDDAKRRAGKPA